MLKITKDTLNYLSIKNAYVNLSNGKKIVCIPIKLYLDCWRVYISIEELELGVLASLEILKIDNSKINIDCRIERINDKHKQYLLFLKKPLPTEMQTAIKSLENKFGQWEKRKGVRLAIGAKNYSSFGLQKKLQTLVVNGYDYSCVLDDVSMHGVRISFKPSKIQDIMTFGLATIPSILGLKLIFASPIFFTIEPIRIHNIDTKTNTISIGCKIREPINMGYINRILDYSKKTEYKHVIQQER